MVNSRTLCLNREAFLCTQLPWQLFQYLQITMVQHRIYQVVNRSDFITVLCFESVPFCPGLSCFSCPCFMKSHALPSLPDRAGEHNVLVLLPDVGGVGWGRGKVSRPSRKETFLSYLLMYRQRTRGKLFSARGGQQTFYWHLEWSGLAFELVRS